ncbi:caspase, EACC1-associated type [Actinoplanes derwentensis]|uniref:PASTA domain, binds beta-lactams n=1 Tax=Actinoplanes derwentensis TaxID=113562 RepID=A0A1H1VDV7_9ACTN|nr:caspase family protein [Actinoplanes derwentensis]GID83729.1 hypothetical protein Ade03nite_26530 [Actinoplanes derwentensis]SDS82883.1 PASTA domain, binds beta-lactams [Actinoplanes derwentensis]
MTAPQTRRRALLLACERFTDDSLPALRSPVRDAKALHQVLDKTGYAVTTLTDCTAHEARHAVAEFFETATRHDVNLIYFSCHGLQDSEMNLHFAFQDSQYRRPDVTGVSAEFVRTQIARSRSRATVVIADCCFSGAFLRAMRPKAGRDAGVNALVRDLPEGAGVAVLTSSGATEVSLEDPDDQQAVKSRGSYFTEALLTGILTGAADTDRDGRITVDELFTYASDRVADGPSHQKPRKYVEAVGEIVVADVRVRGPEPGPPAAAPDLTATSLQVPDRVPPWPPLPAPASAPPRLRPPTGYAAQSPADHSARPETRGSRRRPGIRPTLVAAALAGGLVVWVRWPSAAQADPVMVPPVVGLSRVDAETVIRSARLVPVAVPRTGDDAACTADAVIGQVPAPRSSAVWGSTVTYQVCAPEYSALPSVSGPEPSASSSKPIARTASSTRRPPSPQRVPCVEGKSQDTAEAILSEVGYNVDIVEVSALVAPGTVISQSPDCGVRAARDTTVTISVVQEESPVGPSIDVTSADPITTTSSAGTGNGG